MTISNERLLKLLVRFGIPLLILVFYVGASMHFGYAPDSTYTTLLRIEHSDIRSLWDGLLAFASAFELDLLLTAKVLSLFFSCWAILLSYLIAYEVLRDHLHAFLMAVCLSVEAWLLQIAPSGSGTGFALFLTLASVFFLLRNNYLLSSVLAGVATLVIWQASLLLVALIVDAWFNSVNPGRGRKVMLAGGLVYLAILLPWFLYSYYRGEVILPNELYWSDAPALSMQMSFEALLLSGLMFVGVVLLAARQRQTLRVYSALLLWIGMASFTSKQLLLLVFPLILTFSLLSARLIAGTFRKPMLEQIAVTLVAGLIIAYSQFVARPATVRALDLSVAEANSMRLMGDWLRTNTQEDATVMFPAGREGILGYYSGRRNAVEGAGYRISDSSSVAGFIELYDPSAHDSGTGGISNKFKIWGKQ